MHEGILRTCKQIRNGFRKPADQFMDGAREYSAQKIIQAAANDLRRNKLSEVQRIIEDAVELPKTQ